MKGMLLIAVGIMVMQVAYLLLDGSDSNDCPKPSGWIVTSGQADYNQCFAIIQNGAKIKQVYLLNDCADTLKLQGVE